MVESFFSMRGFNLNSNISIAFPSHKVNMRFRIAGEIDLKTTSNQLLRNEVFIDASFELGYAGLGKTDYANKFALKISVGNAFQNFSTAVKTATQNLRWVFLLLWDQRCLRHF